MNEIYEHIPDVDLHRIGGRIGSSSWKDNVKSNTTPSRLGKKQIVLGVRQSICKKTFYEQVNIGNHLMVLVDELHTIGAKESSNFLNTIQLKYKLGLSATYERANDYLGTKRIIDYFGKALEPKYGLSEAIADKKLVQYDYELLTVSLNAEEEVSWIEQSKKISAEWAKYEANKTKKAMPGKLKMMLIERAKISKKASNKTKKAVDVIKKNYKYDEVQRWLVYCQDLEQLGELQQKLFEEDFKVNNFPCKFMKSLFDIETCSNEFKNSFLMRKMSFDMLRESFNFVDDFSCYKLNKSSKNDNNLLKKFLPMEKINGPKIKLIRTGNQF